MNYKKDKIKTVFIGTPDFAVPSLRALINDTRFEVAAVVTQPDKKVGRKQILTPPPVKVETLKHNVNFFQPNKIENLKSEILKLKPDIIIVAAYAQIMPKSILEIPKYGCINIHASLLPRYRGASPIQAAIMNGDGESGITIMRMEKKVDTGPILTQMSIKILPDDTSGSLYKKLSELGAEILIPSLVGYTKGEIKPIPQDEQKASYAGLIKKKDGRIDWNKSAEEIERFVRAMNPWPGAFASLKIKNQKSPASTSEAGQAKIKNNNQILKIIEVEFQPLKINNYKAGEIFLYNNKLAVQCGKDSLIIKKVQLEGKKALPAQEFIRGQKDLIGKFLI